MEEAPGFLRSKYDGVELIGEGAHGRVYSCVLGGVTTAVKILAALDQDSRRRFEQEVNILRRIDHTNESTRRRRDRWTLLV